MPTGTPKNGINKGWFKKGDKLSDKTKEKLSKINKGKKFSEETRKKISESHRGKKFSDEHKRKLSEIKKGSKLSEETRKKMSDTHKKIGAPWNKDKKHTEEHNKKISEANKGEKAYQWKGGISTINEKLRHNFEFRLWRKSCLERDNFTCQKYGMRGGKLHAHHINNFSDFPELRLAIDNGITLSEKAHQEFHKKYGFKNNTREQLNEFLNSEGNPYVILTPKI